MAVVTNFVPDPSFELATSLTTSSVDGNWDEYNKSANLYSYLDTSNHTQGAQSCRIQNAVTGDYGRTLSISLPAGTYTAGASAQCLAGTSSAPFVQACFVVRRSSDLNLYVQQHWTTASGAWVQKTQTFTLTEATVVDVLIGVGSYGTQSGGSARFDGIFVTNGSSTTYFDGSTTSTSTVTYAWSGTVNNSASTATDVTAGSGGSTGGGSTGGGSTGGGSTTPATTIQGWDLVEHNDFTTATSIDTTRFYIKNGFNGTSGDGYYHTDRTFLSGGAVVIQPDQDYIGGFDSRHRPLIYGKWVIRTKVTNIKGYKWVVFLWPDSEKWPEGELDFFECTDSSGETFQIFFHKVGNPTDNSAQTRVTQKIYTDWVEMSIEWLPSRVTVLCNGKKVYETTDTNFIPKTPMHLVCQVDVGMPDNKNYVPVRANYPANVSPPFQAQVQSIDIYQPSTWYANGAPPTTDLATRQTQARALYDAFVAACYVTTGMPAGMPAGAGRIRRPENGNDTVSEGLAYAMILFAYYSNPALPSGIYDPTAKTKFDSIWTYAKFYRLPTGVINWHEYSDGTKGTGNDSGGATDADQDMAFALDMIDKILGSSAAFPYGTDSLNLTNAIGSTEYVPHTGHAYPDLMANGDQWGVDTNWYMPDYFHPAWMRNAYARSGDPAWLTRISANYPIARGYFDTHYSTGFLPDQCQRDGTAVPGNSYLWSYNAIRVWRTVLDFLWNGSNADTLAHTQATKLANYLKAQCSGNPANMFAEYSLDGSSHASYTNMAFVQAACVASLADSSNSDFAAACLTYLYNNRTVSGNATYFGLSLGAITGLIAAGLAQPFTTTAPNKQLSTAITTTSSVSNALSVPARLSTTIVDTSAISSRVSVAQKLSSTLINSSALSASLTAGTGRPTVALSVKMGGGSALVSALFQSNQQLATIIMGQASGLVASLSNSIDLSIRPQVGAVAEQVYASLAPITDADADNDWALLRYVAALSQPIQETYDLVRDTDAGVGWSSAMDLERTPSAALPWLAQFVGVDTIEDLDDESQRLRIRETSGFQRGTLASIQGAARQYLNGNRTVVVNERDTSPYHLTVTTFSAETPYPDKTAAALQAAKPAGLVLQFVVSSGATYNALKATGLTYDQLKAQYPTAAQMKLAVLV